MRTLRQDPFASSKAARPTLPFLPTLVTAGIIGAASLLCREPGPVPEPPRSPAVDALAFHPAAPVEDGAGRSGLRLPATLAFAGPYPLDLRPAPALAEAARPRRQIAASRRSCPGPRCPDPAPRRAEPVPFAPVEAEAESLLPDLALPFAAPLAPTARAVGDAADFLRSRSAALSGSVAVLLDGMR